MEKLSENGGIFCGPIILRVRAEVSSTGPFPVHSHCISVAGCSLAIHEKLEKNGDKERGKGYYQRSAASRLFPL